MRISDWSSDVCSSDLAGTSHPDGAQRDRLLELQYVIEQLSDAFDREGIEIWLHRPQRALQHKRPIDALQAGQFHDFLSLVASLAAGPTRSPWMLCERYWTECRSRRRGGWGKVGN